ncbi:MAG: ABC transporter permease [Anaerolineae bacterium]|nr:ABC transporter permease [Anaerolineae bacterium]
MKILSIAKKSLLELWREPLLLGLLLFFPVVLVGFYYLAFGHTEGGLAAYLDVLVANNDAGTTLPNQSTWQAGNELLDVIQAAEFEDQPIFDVAVVADPHSAEITLRERKAAMLVVIPPNFSQALVEGMAGTGPVSPAAVALVGDPNNGNFMFARSFMEGLVRQYTLQTMQWSDEHFAVNYEFLPGTGTMSDFDFGVAGIIIFGIAFVVITTATVLVRENVQGTLPRLRLTRARAGDLLIGVTLGQMAVIVVQMLLTFGAARVLGFQNNGSLLLVIIIGLLFSLAAVGAGLLVACFARNDGEVANLGSAVLVPLVFLSGALFPMPKAPLFTIGGRTIEAYDILPATHTAAAMRKVLIFGDGLADIGYELVMMTVLSALILIVGIVMYQRLQLRKG